VYVGETWRLLNTRKKEHQSKVRMTNEDIENGKLAAANERMGKEDGGLARHSVDCLSGVDLENISFVAKEKSEGRHSLSQGNTSWNESVEQF
jgi:hypothetical protein